MNHFDEMTVLLYLEGQLDAEHAREVKEHAASCPSCRALLGALESEGVWLRESLSAEDESVPARLVAAPERGAAPWGWLTALGLGAGGAYTVWTGFGEPGRRKQLKLVLPKEICSRCFSSAVHFGKDGTQCEAQWKSWQWPLSDS